MHGVIVMDKPTGLSSNQAMAKVKRLLGISKMGFLGTLDPLATGVLPLFADKATKLIAIFEGLEKEYRVTIKLGQRTDTLDAEGQVVETRALGALTAEQAGAAVLTFSGEGVQDTPAYSAVKHEGKPAYRLAREGRNVPQRQRRVRFSAMEIEEIALPRVTFRVVCSAGSYMRQLADDIGQRLEVGAHVTALRRLRCGNLFTLSNSISLEGIQEAVEQGDFGFLRDPVEFTPEYLPVMIGECAEDKLKNGQPIPLACTTVALKPADKIKALRASGTLVAIGEAVQTRQDTLMFQPRKVLI